MLTQSDWPGLMLEFFHSLLVSGIKEKIYEGKCCSLFMMDFELKPKHSHIQTNDTSADMKFVILLAVLSGVFAAPFLKEEEAKRFIRLKRQAGYWDPNYSQNQWGYTVQEQANEYWTAIRTDAQYYMDISNLMFDRSVATENNRMYMEMLRNARAHLDSLTGRNG